MTATTLDETTTTDTGVHESCQCREHEGYPCARPFDDFDLLCTPCRPRCDIADAVRGVIPALQGRPCCGKYKCRLRKEDGVHLPYEAQP